MDLVTVSAALIGVSYLVMLWAFMGMVGRTPQFRDMARSYPVLASVLLVVFSLSWPILMAISLVRITARRLRR